MSSLNTIYLCEPPALDRLTKLFTPSLGKPEEHTILDLMRATAATPNRLPIKFLVIKGLTPLLTSQYSHPETAITLFKEALRKISRDATILVEANKITWTPTNRSQVTVDGTTIPIESIDIEQTLKHQTDYNIKNFIKIRL
jgi:hypothetical protein